ncbi:POL1 protein, partial [Urocolius indicus]|nr:POL1 protein [Urocolius indicus]
PTAQVRVLDAPQEGPTLFTDASSVTKSAVIVWQDQREWRKVTFSQTASSVQYLEALAVSKALSMYPDTHANVVTDSMFVFKLVRNMSQPGWAGSKIALLLEASLQRRSATATIIHVNSHSRLDGFFQTSNTKADEAARGVWTLAQARQLHEDLHLGPKALSRRASISISEARGVVATCPHCQK